MIKIGIFGYGAVGASIYSELETNFNSCYIVADTKRINCYSKKLIINHEKEINVRFSDNILCDYLFICVKNYQLKDSIKSITRFIKNETIIIPMLNGIDAYDYLKMSFPNNRIFYGVINIEANKTNNVLIKGKILNLQFGYEYNDKLADEIIILKNILDNSKINNNVYPDMKKRVWLKYMLNMGINQVSALANFNYQNMNNELILESLYNIFNEVLIVAEAYNINITKDDVNELMIMCKNFNSERFTSLALDYQNNRKNEIDTFSGRLIELASKKNIDIPINKFIYSILKTKNNINNI